MVTFICVIVAAVAAYAFRGLIHRDITKAIAASKAAEQKFEVSVVSAVQAEAKKI